MCVETKTNLACAFGNQILLCGSCHPHGDVCITLAVAAFNARAITVYERCGFVETGRHVRRTAGADWEFVDMELRS